MVFDVLGRITQNGKEMEMYYAPFILDAPIVTLIVGLLIMFVGGFLTTTLIKDSDKSLMWLVIVEVVGGIVNIASVVMLLI